MLINGVKKLEKAGADFIAIPCNTVTYYIDEMQDAIRIPILNILQETVNEVVRSKIKKVGLLATETTIDSKIYENLLKKLKVLTLEKTEQRETTRIIMNILAGRKTQEDKKRLLEFIEELKMRGAERVILGCTELPLLIKENNEVFDSLEILARSTVMKATKAYCK